MRFAFYGRVSTEDQQDPESSKGWQLNRSKALIEPRGGEIVTEFFDIGMSRSLPWKRRPQALALLDALRLPDRGFEGVVIGEPARAFYGNQFGLTFPVFVHYGVQLWVPEVGGAVDPGSDAHDLVMSLYGGMSKGERNRIKIRVRSAMASQAASEGRFLGGRPPYGYQLADAGPHPNPGKAAAGQRAHQLEIDPIAAPVVKRIFDQYVSGRGLHAIAEGLTRDGIPSPSAHDPARNRHRQRGRGAWGKSAIRAIVKNPRYVGRQVWNKQRRDEVLLDVEDVAAGHETKMRWNDRSEWIWSDKIVHEPIISPETFTRAQEVAAAGVHRPLDSKKRPTSRKYALSGLLMCGLCGKKMQAHVHGGNNYYRCRFSDEYAVTDESHHPKTLYVRESSIVPGLDDWLVKAFSPKNLDQTCAMVAAVAEVDEAGLARAEAARKKLADCEERLARYRATLDAGGDPVVVSSWIAEVQGEKLAAERAMAAVVPGEPLSRSAIKALVKDQGRALTKLARADAALKSELYTAMGLRLEYVPGEKKVRIEAPLDARVLQSVSEGGLAPQAHIAVLRGELDVA